MAGCCPIITKAQPYIDLLNVRYTNSPAHTGLINQDEPDLKLNHFFGNINLPIPLKLDRSDVLVISPYFEQWDVGVEKEKTTVQGFGLPVGIQKKLNEKWGMTALLFYRYNRQTPIKDDPDISDQWGGVLIANLRRNPSLVFRFGVYYNKEFFGHFVVPLLGLDWKLNDRNNIFGTLPGAITWERKVTGKFYYGMNFRAITNSYRLRLEDPCASGDCSQRAYLRIDENQVGFYADVYLTKKLVLNGEIGHSVLRKLRYGITADKGDTRQTLSQQDNFYFRISTAYRLRLR
ncbi:DUF6268 family outer membrane beta-barrel protein [Flavihumibacter rivuli]|uniref:DUF6268 family outer membrane beta-barrel protein n=1 Tax=Flavihumibacter rivuli TaxID=2838156 RepID=UPI001BDEB401|nr:DUF6268 family outer membrane beta-barrel protein [Flavihumibacter rivuli]ULQ55365.1 DUF6268 family outer membrane beta-barrel protein [Flavihumibacter rivuli]